MTNSGLSNSDIDYIHRCLRQFPEIESVKIFGSRAMGNYKPGSDVDLALFGKDVNMDTLAKLKSILEDSGPLPYLFDLVDYKEINAANLAAHIDEFGTLFYPRSGGYSSPCTKN